MLPPPFYNLIEVIGMPYFKTPPEILRKIEICREKKEKILELNDDNLNIELTVIPSEIFSLSHLKK